MSTTELSEERARLLGVLLQRRAELLRAAAKPEGTGGPTTLQRQQEDVDTVAAQLRAATAELERRTAEAPAPAPRPRTARTPLAERQQTQTWHHRRPPLGDRHEEERHSTR